MGSCIFKPLVCSGIFKHVKGLLSSSTVAGSVVKQLFWSSTFRHLLCSSIFNHLMSCIFIFKHLLCSGIFKHAHGLLSLSTVCKRSLLFKMLKMVDHRICFKVLDHRRCSKIVCHRRCLKMLDLRRYLEMLDQKSCLPRCYP